MVDIVEDKRQYDDLTYSEYAQSEVLGVNNILREYLPSGICEIEDRSSPIYSDNERAYCQRRYENEIYQPEPPYLCHWHLRGMVSVAIDRQPLLNACNGEYACEHHNPPYYHLHSQ